MSQRFLDLRELIAKDKNFVKRQYSAQLSWIFLAFLTSFVVVAMLYLYFSPEYYLYHALAIMAMMFLWLGSLVFFYMKHDRDILSATDFQNALFAGAAHVGSEFCLLMRHDGAIVYADPEFYRRYGTDSERKTVLTIEALLESGDFDKEAKRKVQLALQEGKSETIRFNGAIYDKRRRLLSLSLDPIGVYSTEEDEGKLRLSISPISRPSGFFFLKVYKDQVVKEEFEGLQAFPIGIYMLNDEGVFIQVNKILVENLGYTEEEFLEKNMALGDIFFSKADTKKFSLLEKYWNGEVTLKHKYGKAIQGFLAQNVFVDSKGNVLERRGVIVFFSGKEVTNLATKGIKNGRLGEFLGHSPIATAILSTSGKILVCNRIFHKITGGLGKEGGLLLDCIEGGYKVELAQLLEEIVKGKVVAPPAPLDVMMAGEKPTTASLYLSGIMDNFGEQKGIVCHLMDTTEIKHLQLHVVHSQKMQAVGQLAGGIAHDFNNLLTAMIGFCDLLLTRHPPGDQSFAEIMQIKQNANRAANLIRQLLAFSRKQTLQPEVLNLTNVLADLSNLIGRLIGENIELNMVYGREVEQVKVDQGQLEQVIVNLAVNARDAMQDGGTLTIQTSLVTIDENHPLERDLVAPAEDDPIAHGCYVLVEVIDSGIGMDQKMLSNIFEPFFTTKELGSGTGLGLSTVYGIVKQTGGYIYVTSKKGKGTRFCIFLKHYPLDGVAEEKAALEKETEVLPANADLTGKGTILLVEDEEPVRIFSASALRNKGYTILEANSSHVALDIIKDKGHSIDVIITDVVMPGMKGPAMIEKISEQFPDIKVIFISGYTENAFADSYKDERSFHFLAKPYTLKQLATKVKEVMEEGAK